MNTNLQVAQTIADQIGHKAFVMMGTRHKLADERSLSFDVRGSRVYNKVQVTLEPNDTYTVKFFKFWNFELVRDRTVDLVYADGLKQVIEHNTGLYLSL